MHGNEGANILLTCCRGIYCDTVRMNEVVFGVVPATLVVVTFTVYVLEVNPLTDPSSQ